MNEPKEITIHLKDDDKRTTHKFLIYENVNVSSEDETIRNCILEAKKSFDGNPESIKVKIHLEVI